MTRYKKEANYSHGHKHTPSLTISSCSFCHAMLIWKGAHPASLQNDTKLHRITCVSWPWCLLTTAKINPVLARTRTFSAPCSILSPSWPDPAPSNYIHISSCVHKHEYHFHSQWPSLQGVCWLPLVNDCGFSPSYWVSCWPRCLWGYFWHESHCPALFFWWCYATTWAAFQGWCSGQW